MSVSQMSNINLTTYSYFFYLLISYVNEHRLITIQSETKKEYILRILYFI